MKKLNISINLLQLQGAVRATIKGEDCVILRLEHGRAKPHQNGKVYLNLEAVSNRDGEDQYGNSHFVCEPTTKEDRMSGATKLPIIGNAMALSATEAFSSKPSKPLQLARLGTSRRHSRRKIPEMIWTPSLSDP